MLSVNLIQTATMLTAQIATQLMARVPATATETAAETAKEIVLSNDCKPAFLGFVVGVNLMMLLYNILKTVGKSEF